MIGAALQELLGLAGARYSCVADPATGRVLAEFGEGGGVVPAGLLAWGGGAVRFLAEADADELDDLIVTSRRNYHLVRPVGSGTAGRLLVYLRLDRARGNLAAARRELASPRVQERLVAGVRSGARAAIPATHPHSPATEGDRLGPRTGSLAALPRGAASTAALSPAGAAGRPRAGGPARSVSDPPRRASAPAIGPRRRGPVTALPRRAAAPPPRLPPPAVAEAGATVPDGVPGRGRTWANDAGTLRRLLAALRRMS